MQIFAYVLKPYSVILQFLGIFNLAKLICISLRTFILPSFTKFQEKKILSGCFKFDDLNLELAEVIEILKATAQHFGKSETATFWNNENSLHHFSTFLIVCTWVELLLPCKDRFRPQCHLPLYFCPHHSVSFFMIKMSMALVSYFLCSTIFIDFPFWIFWIFNISEDLSFRFYVSSEAKEETNYQLWMVIIQMRTSKRLFWQKPLFKNFLV